MQSMGFLGFYRLWFRPRWIQIALVLQQLPMPLGVSIRKNARLFEPDHQHLQAHQKALLQLHQLAARCVVVARSADPSIVHFVRFDGGMGYWASYGMESPSRSQALDALS